MFANTVAVIALRLVKRRRRGSRRARARWQSPCTGRVPPRGHHQGLALARPSPPKPRLFERVSDEDLLSYGVPPEWLGDVRAATEDTLFGVAEHLPPEAAEALLDLAVGAKPRVTEPVAADRSPFDHPDARRRFRLMTNVAELERALDYPWEKWSVFLHPAQQDLVGRRFTGPARVVGSAGTGKTVVALHRAAFLARARPSARVLLTTFSEPLANALRAKLRVLLGNEPAVHDHVVVRSIDAIGVERYTAAFGAPRVADDATVREVVHNAARTVAGHRFSDRFLRGEWEEVVDAWQLKTWADYRDVSRLGRKTRLGEKQRAALWQILERVRRGLEERGMVTMPTVFARVTPGPGLEHDRPFDHVVVDEAQDMAVPQLGFVAALAGAKANGLFFTGDLGQRIFRTPFSWKSLGVDIRGRSVTLRVNYRTSHQIRRQADRLLPSAVSDVDGYADDRARTVSVFTGPEPEVLLAKDEEAEVTAVATWLRQRSKEGLQPHEVGIFVRDTNNCPAPAGRPRPRGCWWSSWTNAWKRRPAARRSQPCMRRRDWSSGPS